jgi:hypothetical protein
MLQKRVVIGVCCLALFGCTPPVSQTRTESEVPVHGSQEIPSANQEQIKLAETKAQEAKKQSVVQYFSC